MLRTWATGSAHDDKPLDWLFDLRYGKDITHIESALSAALDDGASVGACQTALLAAECVAFLRGGPADLHEDAHAWLDATKPQANDDLVELAARACERIATDSKLAAWWRDVQADEHDTWLASVRHLGERVRHVRKPVDDATGDPELDALKDDYGAAAPHLRLSLVPGAVDEPVAQRTVADLTLVLYYALPDKPARGVPVSHVKAWNRPVMKAAAQRTRDIAELQIKTMQPDGLELTAVFGRDRFTAGMAMFVDMFLDEPAPYGVLLGIPFAGAFVFHRIANKRWYDAAKLLIQNIHHLHDNPDPISTELYWWRGDADIILQPHSFDGDLFAFSPSAELLDAVAQLDRSAE